MKFAHRCHFTVKSTTVEYWLKNSSKHVLDGNKEVSMTNEFIVIKENYIQETTIKGLV